MTSSGASETLRLFVALEPPPELRQALTALRDRLPDDRSVRWVRAENLHLTLRFLGDTPIDDVPALQDSLVSVGAGHHAMDLRLEGGGAFPPRGAPKVVWVGVAGDVEQLLALAAAVEEAVVKRGHPPENRGFRAHVTLARVRRGKPRGLREALAGIGEIGSFTARELALVSSVLTPSGARYTTLFRAPLT